MRPATLPLPHNTPAAGGAVAIIPARYASTRLPAKPLADIGGRTMIEHVYRHAADARSVDRVLVATDDDRIARAVTAFGGDVRMTRADHASGTDRLAEVAAGLDCDLVVNVQGDEPLIAPEVIDAAVAAAADPAVAMSTLRCPLAGADAWRDPDVVKVAVDRAGWALFFSRAPIGAGLGATAAPPPAVDKHLGLYVYRRPFLLALSRLEPTPLERAECLEQLRALEHGHRVMTTRIDDDPIGVDTPADLDRVRRRLAAGAPA